MSKQILCALGVSATFVLPATAQGSVFQTPGMPRISATYPEPGSSTDSGQANRFSSVFNPAFSFVVDSMIESIHNSGSTPDSESIELRALEFAAQSWVDPNAWAYFVAVADEENVAVEEAAVHYTGLGGNHTLRAGRFFIDFGKQMQTHVHELRTIDRPLALRTYLGDEVKGDGLQWDSWTSVGDTTAVRWSIGAFSNLLPESVEDIDPDTQAAQSVSDQKHAEDFNFTARVTGFTDVGESGVLQVGASARFIPSYSFTFEPSGNAADDLDNTVFGLDATYGWTDDSGLKSWTFGGEYLLNTGDTYSTIGDAGTPLDPTDDTVDVASDDLGGFYLFGDYAWDKSNSVGLQYSQIEAPEAGTPDVSETEAYYTRMFSEFHRVRIATSALDRDEGEDSLRFAIQYTVFVGAHGHGVNW